MTFIESTPGKGTKVTHWFSSWGQDFDYAWEMVLTETNKWYNVTTI